MKHITLDTNCIYEIENAFERSPALVRLVELGNTTRANLRIPAIAASERQLDGQPLDNFREFLSRIANAGLSHAEILLPMFYWWMAFLDWGLIIGDEMLKDEEKIHLILFPQVAFKAADHCPKEDEKGRAKWRNAKCDVQSMWCHIYYQGDIFVSRDRVFHQMTKKSRLEKLGAGTIATPEEAIAVIEPTWRPA